MKVLNIHDAKTQLSRLIVLAEKGHRITIARNGKAVAQLGPITSSATPTLSLPDPLLRVDEYSYADEVSRLSNREMDELIYGG